MYQTVGHQGVSLYAEAMGLPLFREETSCVAHNHHKWYQPTEGDEVEDLYNLLARVKVNLYYSSTINSFSILKHNLSVTE